MDKIPRLILIIVLLAMSGLCGFGVSWYLHGNDNTMTLPADEQVIQTFHYPALFVKQIEGDPQAGKKIFREFCTSCHGKPPLINIPAPRIGDKKIWRGLRQVGVEKLLKITISGVGAMPARGGCFECSDEQLRETIQYILDQS